MHTRLRSMTLLLCFFVVCILYASACSAPTMGDTTLRIERADLFAGDAKKFQPFLGHFAGSAKVHYRGHKPNLQLLLEIWENGKRTQNSAYGGKLLQGQDAEKGFEGEVIVAVKPIQHGNDSAPSRFVLTSAIADKNGSISSEMTLDSPVKLGIMGTISIQEVVEARDGEEVPVWGFHASDTNAIETSDFSEESLAKVRWALIVKIVAADEITRAAQ